MSSRRRLAVVMTVAAVVGTLASSAHAAAPPKPDAADAALDEAIQQLVKEPSGPPGIISVVQRGDEVKVHTSGVADLATGAPLAVDDHMRAASVAKTFSGAAALSVVAEGALSLSDTIGDRLPDLPKAWKDVTLARAMQHTSGLPDFTKSEAFGQAVNAAPFDPPPPVELLSYVEDAPLEFEPGSQYRYSNTDNVVVGLMVEAATGRPYEEVLQERVFGPLELASSSLPRGAAIPVPFIHGYTFEPPEPPFDGSETVFAMGWAWASGGIVSTPGDLNRFIRSYAAGATTDKAALAEQRTFVKGSSDPPGPGANSAGLSIFRYKTPCGTLYGHTGNITGGYTQFVGATRDGSRSATVSVSEVITPKIGAEVFPALRKVFRLAACAALADG